MQFKSPAFSSAFFTEMLLVPFDNYFVLSRRCDPDTQFRRAQLGLALDIFGCINLKALNEFLEPSRNQHSGNTWVKSCARGSIFAARAPISRSKFHGKQKKQSLSRKMTERKNETKVRERRENSRLDEHIAYSCTSNLIICHFVLGFTKNVLRL